MDDLVDDLQVVRHTRPSGGEPSVTVSLTPQGQVIDLRDRPPDELTPALAPFLTAEALTAPDDIAAARRLAASVYVASGFVEAEDLTLEGTIAEQHDPWVLRSTYFAVLRDGEPAATARQIEADDPTQLPALRLPGLYPEPLAAITELAGHEVVEISALARRPKASSVVDVTAVYSRMWQFSLARNHRVWVMAIDARVYRQLHDFFCGDSVRPIGEEQHYLGSSVVPAAIWCEDVNPEMSRRARGAGPQDFFKAVLPHLFPHPAPSR